MDQIPEGMVSRMTAICHYFGLDTIEKKKEYAKLSEEDRKELAICLTKVGYKIKPE